MDLPPLYILIDQYAHACEVLQQLDLDDQVVADTLESMQGDIEQKCVAIAKAARNMEVRAEQVDAAADVIDKQQRHMRERATAQRKRAGRLKDYVRDQLTRINLKRIDRPDIVLLVTPSPPRVVVDAVSEIPSQFWKLPKIDPSVDKQAILAAIRGGESVPGVHLEQRTRLDLK